MLQCAKVETVCKKAVARTLQTQNKPNWTAIQTSLPEVPWGFRYRQSMESYIRLGMYIDENATRFRAPVNDSFAEFVRYRTTLITKHLDNGSTVDKRVGEAVVIHGSPATEFSQLTRPIPKEYLGKQTSTRNSCTTT